MDDLRQWTVVPGSANRKTKISVTLDSTIVDRMDYLSHKTNRTRSNIINEALKRTLPPATK